ncbi:MAG: nucleotidyltransferase domain-containing protein [Candidatus Helarchaeota archaeon]
MKQFKVRDRDAPISPEGIIFRAYGYYHPPNSCICDVEYAHSRIYQSKDPRAPRISKTEGTFYKFYADGGLNFVKEKYPQYLIFYDPLQNKQVGIEKSQMKELRKPDDKLKTLYSNDPPDLLIELLIEILEIIQDHSQLKSKDFGIFGSILHEFYHLNYSDIDFIIYGKKNLIELREVLDDFYNDKNFPFKNEFENISSETIPKHWYFKNYSIKEYIEYQKRKIIYAIHKSKKFKRSIKLEFEPVKNWNEIIEKYDTSLKIERVGWISAIGRIIDDSNGYYIGGICPVEIEKVIKGPKVDNIIQIVNYIEEFRGQLISDDSFIIEGNLEQVIEKDSKYYQITLTYGKNYDYQVLKKTLINSIL